MGVTLYCKIRSRDLTSPTLGEICHTMANTSCTKYAVSIFNRSQDIKGVRKFETPSRDLSHAHLGKILHSRERAPALFYHTKYKEHSFIRSNVMEEPLILKLGHQI